jgi:hypothetical protein
LQTPIAKFIQEQNKQLKCSNGNYEI